MYVTLQPLPLNDEQEPVEIESQTFLIGRSGACDLRLNNSLVSRVHCRLTVTDDGVYAQDLESRNGTWVNYCEQLHTKRRLYDGDVLVIAITPFRVSIKKKRDSGSGLNLLLESLRERWNGRHDD